MKDHNKSRRGCLQCKQRKVKCDETLPSCERCRRRRAHCSYIDEYSSTPPPPSAPGAVSPARGHHGSDALAIPAGLNPPGSPSPGAIGSGHGRLSPSAPNTISSSLPEQYVLDLELTHLYLTSTYKSLWGREAGQVLWRDIIFRHALNHPPLLDALLGTAALHRIAGGADEASLGPEDTPPSIRMYERAALQKQARAMEGLVSLLSSLHADNCGVVFVLSCLVSIWTFASRRLPQNLSVLSKLDEVVQHHHSSSSPPPSSSHLISPSSSSTATATATTTLSHFLELIYRIQPVNAIVREARPWLLSGSISELFQGPPADDEGDDADYPPSSPQAIAIFDLLDHHIRRSSSVAAACYEPDFSSGADLPGNLRFMWRVSRCPEWLEIVMGWPMTLPPEFLGEIRRREAPALTMVGFWAVCFHALDGRWWAEGWARALLGEIKAVVVDGVWAELLTELMGLSGMDEVV